MPEIKVIDAPCGKGKTSFAIQMMNDNPEQSYIYCTPFLNEIQRIINCTNIDIQEPHFKNGGRKIEDFNTLLMSGNNIALTHSTFANSNNETLEYINDGKYTLILDEVLDILVNYQDVCHENLSPKDIELLINEGFIAIDNYGKVSWLKSSYPTSKYYNVERLSKAKNLYYLDKTMLVWQFPAEIFRAFKQVYVLTYLFDGSFLKPYFEYHNINFILKSVIKDDNGHYRLIPYISDRNERSKYKDLITIYNNKKANNYKAGSLSKAWFSRQITSDISNMRNNLFNYLHNIKKAKSKDIMWTCPDMYRSQLKGKGYSIVRRLTSEELSLNNGERKQMENKLNCFVPLNARATNDYCDRSVLAYMFNMYANPYIKRYFENKNKIDGTNICVNQDYLALSCLIQWIWRSQIRNDRPISIYIPSERMRTLFIKWINGDM